MFAKIALLCLVAIVTVTAAPSNRIIGGSGVRAGEYPHQVSIHYGNFLGHYHACGGSILNNKWILTAARCIKDNPRFPLGVYYIVAGINYLTDPRGQTIKTTREVIHPGYTDIYHGNDIALLELGIELSFNNKVQPIALPAADSIPTGNANVTGWGSTSNTIPEVPGYLQRVELPVITIDQCRSALIESVGSAGSLSDTNLCTGPLSGGRAPCTTDSGGPLVAKDGDNMVQIGIVSWGITPCGQQNIPSVFTRVSAYIDFIKKYVPITTTTTSDLKVHLPL